MANYTGRTPKPACRTQEQELLAPRERPCTLGQEPRNALVDLPLHCGDPGRVVHLTGRRRERLHQLPGLRSTQPRVLAHARGKQATLQACGGVLGSGRDVRK